MHAHDDPELSPLIGAVPVEGPAAILVAVPWIFLAAVLAGPFALLFTFVLVALAIALVLGAVAAIVASPFLLVRHARAAEARREASRERVQPAPTPISLPGY